MSHRGCAYTCVSILSLVIVGDGFYIERHVQVSDRLPAGLHALYFSSYDLVHGVSRLCFVHVNSVVSVTWITPCPGFEKPRYTSWCTIETRIWQHANTIAMSYLQNGEKQHGT